MAANDLELSLVIPAYNEQWRIGPTLQALNAHVGNWFRCEFLVVDDGSEDATARVAQESIVHCNCLRVVRWEKNQGKGAAVRAGILQAAGKSIFVVDADLPYRLDAFDKALQLLESGADLVIGSREHPESEIDPSYPRYRRFAGRFFSRIVNWEVPVQILDTQCGFKVFRKRVARTLFEPLQTRRYAYDIEVLLRARLAGYRIELIPVRLARHHGSRVRFFRDSLQMLRDLRRIRKMYVAGQVSHRS